MSIGESLRNGDLPGAIAAAQAKVKAAPRDSEARWLLAELLLLAGDAERADRMLDAAVLEEPLPAVLEFRRLLRAEVMRHQVWNEGRAPVYQGQQATAAQQAALRALVLLRDGDAAAAALEAASAETYRPPAPGSATLADGTTLDFDDMRDADDLAAPQLEVLTMNGEHMLVPFERLASLVFTASPTGSKRPRDLAWRRAEIQLKDGTDGVVFVNALYPPMGPSGGSLGDDAKLGRVTDWIELAAGAAPLVRGQGQRLLLLGEEAVPVADLASLTLR